MNKYSELKCNNETIVVNSLNWKSFQVINFTKKTAEWPETIMRIGPQCLLTESSRNPSIVCLQNTRQPSKSLKMNAGVASSVLKALAAGQVEIEEFHQLQVVMHHFLKGLLSGMTFTKACCLLVTLVIAACLAPRLASVAYPAVPALRIMCTCWKCMSQHSPTFISISYVLAFVWCWIVKPTNCFRSCYPSIWFELQIQCM